MKSGKVEKVKDFESYKKRNREQKAQFQEDIARIVRLIEGKE